MVESQFGFHIVQLIEKRGAMYRFRHILLHPTYTDDELVEAMRTLDSLVRLVRADSITFDRAALEYSDDPHSKMNGGVVSNHDILERYAGDVKLTQTAFFKEDFGHFGKLDDYNALRSLKPGQISSAFLTQDSGRQPDGQGSQAGAHHPHAPRLAQRGLPASGGAGPACEAGARV